MKFDTNFSLNGKTAVITGGAKGIGKAIAGMFAEKGADVIICDSDDKGLETADSIKNSTSISATYHKVDVTRKTEIYDIKNQILDEYPGIDILVNCAGVVYLDNAENLSENDWDTTIAVNQKGLFLSTQVIGADMIKRRKGKIINIASQAGVVALKGHIAYCASKAAVIAMTKVFALEWAEYGINVNSISPTVVLTELGRKAWAGKKGENFKKEIPAGRFAHPEEIAAAAVFLASDAADMITGENLIIDGGYSIK